MYWKTRKRLETLQAELRCAEHGDVETLKAVLEEVIAAVIEIGEYGNAQAMSAAMEGSGR